MKLLTSATLFALLAGCAPSDRPPFRCFVVVSSAGQDTVCGTDARFHWPGTITALDAKRKRTTIYAARYVSKIKEVSQ